MYIEVVPNRNSKPCILLRESYREGGKVRKRTLANLSKLPQATVEALRGLLRGATVLEEGLADSLEITLSRPFGHVAAVLGTLRQIGLETDLASEPCTERDLVVAMIVARILEPASKLATARGLDEGGALSALQEELCLPAVSEAQLYAALDWLFQQQAEIEQRLSRRHLQEGSLVLYDVTSTYFEGECCPLAQRGYSRDDKSENLQIVFGLLCNRVGCPIAVEIFSGNTADPQTLGSQVEKVRQRFSLQRVIFVGDRGMLTSARIGEDLGAVGLDWISALRTTEIRKVVAAPGFQFSLFDERDFVEIQSPEFPGERLVVCRNPLLAKEREQVREELLQATERKLSEIKKATQRERRPLRGKDQIALRVGKILNRYKVAKHFLYEITESSFSYWRNEESILAEAALDGLYVIRTSMPESEFTAAETVRAYKDLSTVERAFRSMKTVDLHVRPIYHRLPERVRAHVFLCMLAYYVEWHMRQRWAPLLFDDDDPWAGEALRSSVVQPAQRSAEALNKASTRRTPEGFVVQSFQTLLQNLGTIVKNRIQPKLPASPTFDAVTRPSAIQQRALALLDVTLPV
jgi:Transposase DDE domain